MEVCYVRAVVLFITKLISWSIVGPIINGLWGAISRRVAMKKIHHVEAKFILALPLIVASISASALTANVTVTATSSGTLTSTQLAAITGISEVGLGSGLLLCEGAPKGGYTASTGTTCFNGINGHFNTWSVGSFAVTAGRHTYRLNITSSNTVGSLDQLLCGTDSGTYTPPCSVGICIDGATTATSNGACTISTGQINPTCSGGHVTSVTSNLTLTCP